MIILKMDLD
uniref:Uncharacterized protein n=1 Tax=Arundo donax TaxID=35708 RepID=A0A0A9A4C3_ARUDO